jgi:branched-chain amino acid transport system ATP-binding protein
VTDAALVIEHVSLAFGDLVVLSDVNLRVESPFTGIIGPNGAGKTTLFNVVTGVLAANSGRVAVLGSDTTGAPSSRVASLGVRRTFQTPKLVPRLTVLDNVLLGMDGGGKVRSLMGETIGWPSGRKRERDKRDHVRALVSELGLGKDIRVRAENLPLPTQKLVEVARALASRPKLLLLDEPAAGMGRSDVHDLLGPVQEAVRLWGCHVVIIEHDVEMVTELCQDVLVLDFGRVIAQGPAAEVLASPTVMDAYLGAADAEG